MRLQQLRCSSSANQPNFFLILSHYFLIILPCGSLNKSALLLVFTPPRYFSLPHRSGAAHRLLPSPRFPLSPFPSAAHPDPFGAGVGARSPPCPVSVLMPAGSVPTVCSPAGFLVSKHAMAGSGVGGWCLLKGFCLLLAPSCPRGRVLAQQAQPHPITGADL